MSTAELVCCLSLSFKEAGFVETIEELPILNSLPVAAPEAASSNAYKAPPHLSPEISRDAILNLMAEFFTSGITLVSLEGRADVGKTQLLKQFCRTRAGNSVSLFLQPQSWFLNDPGLFYAEVANQMCACLGVEPPQTTEELGEAAVRRLLLDIHRKYQKRKEPFFFVIDGLEDVIDHAAPLVSALIGILPLEFSTFRFLFSGDLRWLPSQFLASARHKSYPVPGFSLEETTRYFDGLSLSKQDIDELYRSLGNGTPGYLASARRLLENGMSTENLISQLHSVLPSPFQVEWSTVRNLAEKHIDALAIVAFDATPHTLIELAEILEIDRSQLEKGLALCSFLQIAQEGRGEVRFISASFRHFVAEQLNRQRSHTWTTLAAHFLRIRETERAVELLPEYLEKAGKTTELLAMLDASTFIQLAGTSDSFAPLVARSRLGFDTAIRLRRYADVFRFGMQSSIVSDVSPLETTKAEVLARLHLGEYKTAIDIAQSTVLKRHRLQLLASIARFQRERGLSAETSVLDGLTHLAEQITPVELGDDLLSTASDLMYARPDLAVRLVTHATKRRPDDRAVDWALVGMTATAARSSATSNSSMTDEAATDIRNQIHNPEVRSLSSAISVLVKGTSSKDVLKQVKTFESAGDQIFFLRQWCRHTREPHLAAPIIDYAVYLCIRTTEYTPTARDYRDLATPLPKVADTTALSSLITAFDIQRAAARTVGPTQDYVKLQLLLAEAESTISQFRAGQRLAEIYYDIEQNQDIEVRSACLALIVSSMRELDPNNTFLDTKDVKDLCEAQFQEDVTKLLESTADHYAVTQPIITALALDRTDLAFDTVQKLNYQTRRDHARLDLVLHLVSRPIADIDLAQLESVLGKFADSELEDNAVAAVLRKLSRSNKRAHEFAANHSALRFINRALDIKNPVTACRTISSALVLLAKAGSNSSLANKLEGSLRNKWKSIDDNDMRHRVGYTVVTVLADHVHVLAEGFLREVANDLVVPDDSSRGTLIQCVRLAIRAYSGLLPKRLESSQDLDRLTQIVESISSRLMRVRLWADLAIRFVRLERTDEGKRIVQSKLRPLLEALKSHTEYDWLEALVYAAPALYISNPLDTLDTLDKLPVHWHTRAYVHLSYYKLTGVPDGEPFRTGSQPYQLNYDTCVEVLKISEHMVTDYTIYQNVASVVESATWKHNRSTFSQTQKNTLAEQIRLLAANKLPSVTGISHDGYRLLTEAQALKLIKSKRADWEPFLERARSITNVSDRVLVLTYLGQSLPSSLSEVRDSVITEARELAKSISSVRDRLSRMRFLASVTLEYDKSLARGLVQDAASSLKNKQEADDDGGDLREIVDLAYQLDPDLAAALASDLDNDEGRQEARKRIRFQKLKERLSEPREITPDSGDVDGKQLAAVCWEMLGQLNAIRLTTRDVSASLSLLRQIRDASFDNSFPVLSFVIENAVSRRGHADEAKVYLRDVFEATLKTCEIAQAVVLRSAGRSVSRPRPQKREGRTLIAAGERQKAFDVIAEWVRLSVTDTLYICDPFFGPRDLEILQIVKENKPETSIVVVTSRKQQEQDGVASPYEEYYGTYWHKNFSEQSPPSTEVVVVGGASGDLPIHDRWLISGSTGLRLGTSLNGLGVGKDAELTYLSEIEVQERMEETRSYVERQKREHLGQKLSYTFFDICPVRDDMDTRD